MEKLTESLAASFQISTYPNDTVSPHPRLEQWIYLLLWAINVLNGYKEDMKFVELDYGT